MIFRDASGEAGLGIAPGCPPLRAPQLVDGMEHEVVQVPAARLEVRQETPTPTAQCRFHSALHVARHGVVAVVEEGATGRRRLAHEQRRYLLRAIARSRGFNVSCCPTLHERRPNYK